AAAKGKGKKDEPPKAPVKKWTKQDEMAQKIQRLVRQFLARRALERKKKEKEEYEELMDRLEKEAFVKLVKMEQEQAEKERQKEEAERKLQRELVKRRKRMLEAAFDGDNDEILIILQEVKALDDEKGIGNDIIGRARRAKNILSMVDCEDANGNTPLSEAASGGNADTVKLLVDNGADLNSRGQFDRTPLYRAAFAGHLEAVQMLLQSGADPRLYANDGQTPAQVRHVHVI
ncbi:hypothetical protein CAPTEDRAFT_55409, partial [Capitella teleta]|uniref:Uncharacterized protein n=1 Tax=Capitella teleta TaxID=283909 RepID=X2B611_CAPTE